MPGAGAVIIQNGNADRVEAPVTLKAYLMCAFAAFGGIFFGYDSGYINGIMGMEYFIQEFGNGTTTIASSTKSLIVSILSIGTFLGACEYSRITQEALTDLLVVVAGDLADSVGRRTTIMLGCAIFCVGAALQCSSTVVKMLVGGRFVAGLGVGFVSAIIILYMSEVAPRKVRGAIVSAYQFCITIGIMLANVVTYGTQNYTNSASYRIPVGIQFVWALILGIGLFLLPETPRYHVHRGELEKATHVLSRLRGQPETSNYITEELAEIVANHDYEMQAVPHTGYFSSWANCFRGSIRKPNSNLRRTILGTSLQMMQQFTGVNFIFYYSTSFFQLLNLGIDAFLLSLITTLINVCSTPISFWTVERFGRRPLLIWGALGMVICQYIVAIASTVAEGNKTALKVEIAFVCVYIFFFASTWYVLDGQQSCTS